MIKKLKRFFQILGPGFITGASDDDPSGIATYSQTGAQFGYSQLWMAVFTFPFMTVIQEMCGRIGMVTGNGLSGVIRQHYPRWILYCALALLFVANTINVGADLGAMASAAQLLVKLPFIVWLLGFTIVGLLLQILIPYPQYSRFLKYLTLSLFAYIITAFIVHMPWQQIAVATVIPHISLNKDYLLNLVAILGTTISPYLFFWQADEEVEKEIEEHKLKAIGAGKPEFNLNDVRDMQLDTSVGMFFSQIVMYFIIVTTAATLGAHHLTQVNTATDAAQALKPFAGPFAFVIFALGIIGTGLLAVPVLAGSSAYAISETFQWKSGLNKTFNQAPKFYLIIIISTIIGVGINFIGIPPFKMLYYTAVLNGLCAPPLMVIIMLISSNSKIMGDYRNNKVSTIVGWIITFFMTVASIALLMSIGHH